MTCNESKADGPVKGLKGIHSDQEVISKKPYIIGGTYTCMGILLQHVLLEEFCVIQTQALKYILLHDQDSPNTVKQPSIRTG